MQNSFQIKMTSLSEQYTSVRTRTVKLCKNLSAEDCVPQSADFVSPPKWHLAHTTWFFEEMILSKFVKDYSVFDSNYGFLFNSYYNAVGDRLSRSQRGLITRPSVDEVYTFREFVDKQMVALIRNGVSKEIEELLILGLNHEQQHQELLLTDLKYTFSQNPLHPVYDANLAVNNYNQQTGWVTIEEGLYSIGYQGDDFCFDNELGNHKVYLEQFEIAESLVTNGGLIDFIENGGYTNSAYWLDEGWSWITLNQFSKPLYWYNIKGEWYHYTLAGLQKIDPKAIACHLSFYEASAFANYKGMRLPTEFEWEVASDKLSWGQRWEWTNSAYLPYPRFAIKEGAVGEYNGKFMINQMVLRGGSIATSKGHTRKTYRNFFHPQRQWQFSGIRLVK